MLLDIQKSRVLKTQHGGYVLQDDVYGLQGRQKQTLLGDPYSLLMAFTSVRGLRLIDLFSSFDKDHDSRLSLQEMKAGIKVNWIIPISGFVRYLEYSIKITYWCVSDIATWVFVVVE